MVIESAKVIGKIGDLISVNVPGGRYVRIIANLEPPGITFLMIMLVVGRIDGTKMG
jgi:hypothetical protein